MISLGKYLHSKQIESLAPGSKVILFAGGILHRIIGRKIILENQPLIFLADSDAGIFYLQLGTDLTVFHRHDYQAVIGRVFNSVADQTFNDFSKDFPGNPVFVLRLFF